MEDKELNKFMKKAGIHILPIKWQNAIKRVYSAYPKECLPSGICDPVYICNIMAKELGLGDGKSNFKDVIV